MTHEKKPMFSPEFLKEVRLGQGNIQTHQQHVQIVWFDKETAESIINIHSLSKILPNTTDTPRLVEKYETEKKAHILRLTQQEYHKIREQFDPVLFPDYETLKFQLRARKNILAKFKAELEKFFIAAENKNISSAEKAFFSQISTLLTLDEHLNYLQHPNVILASLEIEIENASDKVKALMTSYIEQEQKKEQENEKEKQKEEKKEKEKNQATSTKKNKKSVFNKIGLLTSSVLRKIESATTESKTVESVLSQEETQRFNNFINGILTPILQTNIETAAETLKTATNSSSSLTNSTSTTPLSSTNPHKDISMPNESVIITDALEDMFFLFKKMTILMLSIKNPSIINLLQRDISALYIYCDKLANQVGIDFLYFSLPTPKNQQLDKFHQNINLSVLDKTKIKTYLNNTLNEIITQKKSLSENTSFPKQLTTTAQFTHINISLAEYEQAYQNPEDLELTPQEGLSLFKKFQYLHEKMALLISDNPEINKFYTHAFQQINAVYLNLQNNPALLKLLQNNEKFADLNLPPILQQEIENFQAQISSESLDENKKLEIFAEIIDGVTSLEFELIGSTTLQCLYPWKKECQNIISTTPTTTTATVLITPIIPNTIPKKTTELEKKADQIKPNNISDIDFALARNELFENMTIFYFVILNLIDKNPPKSILTLLTQAAKELQQHRKSASTYPPRIDFADITLKISNSAELDKIRRDLATAYSTTKITRYFEEFQHTISTLHKNFTSKYTWNKKDYIPPAIYAQLAQLNTSLSKTKIDLNQAIEKENETTTTTLSNTTPTPVITPSFTSTASSTATTTILSTTSVTTPSPTIPIISKRPSLKEWEKTKYGVTTKVENTQKNFDIHKEAGNNYLFDDLEKLKSFKTDLNIMASASFDPSAEIQFFRDPVYPEKFAVYVGPEEHRLIKKKYLEELQEKHQHRSSAEIQKQIEALNERCLLLNTFSTEYAEYLDSLQSAASNRESKGTSMYNSSFIHEISLQNYIALNMDFLNETEIDTLKSFALKLRVNNFKGEAIDGLNVDDTFCVHITNMTYKDTFIIAQLPEIFKEDAHHQVYGVEDRLCGDRVKPEILTKSKLPPHLQTKNIITRKIPRLAPPSETKEITLASGGMKGHRTVMTISIEENNNTPNGYNYFLTELNAGAGLVWKVKPTYNPHTNKYTTGVAWVEATRSIHAIPGKSLEETVEHLIYHKRMILLYKQARPEGAPINTSRYAEPESPEGQAWIYHNLEINKCLGEIIEAKSKAGTPQLIGNCGFKSMQILSDRHCIQTLGSSTISEEHWRFQKEYDYKTTLKAIDDKIPDLEKELIIAKNFEAQQSPVSAPSTTMISTSTPAPTTTAASSPKTHVTLPSPITTAITSTISISTNNTTENKIEIPAKLEKDKKSKTELYDNNLKSARDNLLSDMLFLHYKIKCIIKHNSLDLDSIKKLLNNAEEIINFYCDMLMEYPPKISDKIDAPLKAIHLIDLSPIIRKELSGNNSETIKTTILKYFEEIQQKTQELKNNFISEYECMDYNPKEIRMELIDLNINLSKIKVNLRKELGFEPELTIETYQDRYKEFMKTVKKDENFGPPVTRNLILNSDDKMLANANNTYPIAHNDIKQLILDFIKYKQDFGSAVEKEFFTNIINNYEKFIDRCYKNRFIALYAQNSIDTCLLRDGTIIKIYGDNKKKFEALGTDHESEPFLLKDYPSMEEIEISALLGISGPSPFINNGNRNNRGEPGEAGSFEKDGIVMGLVGARLEQENVMEHKYVLITKNQNTAENGYGSGENVNPDKAKAMQHWAKFYDQKVGESSQGKAVYRFPSYDEAKEIHDQFGDNSKYIKTKHGDYVNKSVYTKRSHVILEIMCDEADTRAHKAGKKGFVHLVGLGFGVWSAGLEALLAQIQLQVLVNIFNKNKHSNISDVHLAYFPNDEECKANYRALFEANTKLVTQVFSYSYGKLTDERDKNGRLIYKAFPLNEGGLVREMSSPLNDPNKILIAIYAWDGGAHPGNEYFLGEFAATGDPATACATAITLLQCALINKENINGYRVVFYGKSGPMDETTLTTLTTVLLNTQAIPTPTPYVRETDSTKINYTPAHFKPETPTISTSTTTPQPQATELEKSKPEDFNSLSLGPGYKAQ